MYIHVHLVTILHAEGDAGRETGVSRRRTDAYGRMRNLSASAQQPRRAKRQIQDLVCAQHAHTMPPHRPQHMLGAQRAFPERRAYVGLHVHALYKLAIPGLRASPVGDENSLPCLCSDCRLSITITTWPDNDDDTDRSQALVQTVVVVALGARHINPSSHLHRLL